MTISTIAETYASDGFVFPIDLISDAEASKLRTDLESAEADRLFPGIFVRRI